MEKIVAKNLGVEHAHALGGEPVRVDAGGADGGHVVGADAVHAFQGKHALAAVAPEHLGHVQIERMLEIASQQTRSEEHTSELQSLMRISYAVFCLKKNK